MFDGARTRVHHDGRITGVLVGSVGVLLLWLGFFASVPLDRAPQGRFGAYEAGITMYALIGALLVIVGVFWAFRGLKGSKD
jgi:hypothetical protein